MNRRGFLTRLLKSGIYAAVAPQIVTHGLKLIRPRPPLLHVRLAVLDIFTDQVTAVRFHEMGLDYFNAMFDSEKRMTPRRQISWASENS